MRNHLPRTGWGTVLLWLVSALWHGFFAALALILAIYLPEVPVRALHSALAGGLFALFLTWQLIPLMTLSGGWTLDLGKLLVYPISPDTLFKIEASLRLTNSLELLFILTGTLVGLLRSGYFSFLPFFLLLCIPINVFLSLFIYHWLTRTLARKRLKELIALLLINLAVLPSLLLGTPVARYLNPIFRKLAIAWFTPWFAIASLSTGTARWINAVVAGSYLAAVFVLARNQFVKLWRVDQSPVSTQSSATARNGFLQAIFTIPSRLFSDPLAALVEKELRVLARAPRFRVVFGMACFFSVAVFLPFLSFGSSSSSGFLARNYLPTVSVYGLLLVGEVVMWNIFGFDRRAAQLYFLAPISLRTVVQAKNVTAVSVIALMTLAIAVIGACFQTNVSIASIGSSVLLTAVVTLFFLSFGNLTSVYMPASINPEQALRKQNSASASIWLLISGAVLIVPVGAAYLAAWLFNAAWPFYTILGIDLVIGFSVYQVATESAVARAERNKEVLLERLARGADLISS